jgi:hypothetical protein
VSRTEPSVTRPPICAGNESEDGVSRRRHGAAATLVGGNAVRSHSHKCGEYCLGCHVALLEAEELDVTADRLPGADRGHDKDILVAAELERLCSHPDGSENREVRPRTVCPGPRQTD